MNYSYILLITLFIIIITIILIYYFKNQINFTEEFSDSISNYIGKSFNYTKPIKSPDDLGVSSAPNLWVLPGNISASKEYVNYMTTEPPLGNNFFIKSGTCSKKESVDECKGKPRWLFVRNIPDGTLPCTDYKTSLKGIVPGLAQDLADLNPYEIFLNLSGQGSTVSDGCVLRTEMTGPVNNLKPETKCAPPYKPNVCFPEFFTNYNNKS